MMELSIVFLDNSIILPPNIVFAYSGCMTLVSLLPAGCVCFLVASFLMTADFFCSAALSSLVELCAQCIVIRTAIVAMATTDK